MKKRRLTFPLIKGNTSRQAHADLPKGTYEREISRDGFYGNSVHLYHQHKPTDWIAFEGALQPHAFDLRKLSKTDQCPLIVPPLIFNQYGQIKYWICTKVMKNLVSNANGDEVLFIHRGLGDFFCDFGHIAYSEGDFVLVPRGTLWRIEPKIRTEILMTEAINESFYLPEKGMLGYHAIFDRAMLKTPDLNKRFIDQQSNETWEVRVKRFNEISVITYPFNPLDAIGWHGEVSVVKINWRDIRPVMSHRYNLPPSAHCTFISERFDIGTFVPRPIESDPGALKVPFFHSNVDEDEFMFFHQGQFFSRDNIEAGMATLHQSGFVHGPHPKAYEIGKKAARHTTDEVALKIDFRHPVELGELTQGIALQHYKDTWREYK